jgi:thioredoxin-related protein
MRTLTAKNLFQTKQQAKKDNKNILLLMHLEDCSWCHFVISEVMLKRPPQDWLVLFIMF